MSAILVSSVVSNISDLRSKDQEYPWMKIYLYIGKIDRCSDLAFYLLALPGLEVRRRLMPYTDVGSPKDYMWTASSLALIWRTGHQRQPCKVIPPCLLRDGESVVLEEQNV